MSDRSHPVIDEQRLREIAEKLRRAFSVPDQQDLTLSDLTLALDSPELAAILLEIRALREQELIRLERLLAKIVANDP
ncbi:hypothetical protein [Novosphingobium sp.]|uniref:hypothetical protein n=1 Tax=Novosphingobium sp. TaxID=1874826 RepID=UPI0026196B43|nr:hypothetical protein [Novosphingobium sp.]